MADIFNVGGSNSGNSQLDQLVAAYKATQQPQVDRLQQKKNTLEKSSSYYTNLNSRLNSMVSQLDRFNGDDIAENFSSKKVTSSASDFVTASATDSAVDGINTVKVNRLASTDILISSRKNIEDSFNLSGSKLIEFKVNGENKTVTIEFDGTENNSEALAKIVEAINETEDLAITAGKVNDTTTTTRLTLRSDNPGMDNKINFVDSDVFAALGFTSEALKPESSNRTLSTATSAGYKLVDSAELSSSATVNGVDITRNSNTLTDVLTGVTFNLSKVQTEDDSEVILTTDVNTESVEGFIQPFIDNFNNLVRFLNSDKNQLRSDSSVSGLRFSLRSLLTQEVTTAKEGNPKYLTNIGIKISSDGTLSIGDKERLAELLKEDPTKVSDIFLSEEGFVNRVKESVNRLKGDDDLIKQKTLDMATQIDSQQDRIEQLQSRIDRQAESQRNQYQRLLETYYNAQAQYNSFNSFINTSQQF